MLRTREQRANLCGTCPIAKVADIVGDPCSLLIVRDLLEGPRRFGDLDESLHMSTRTLTKTLRRLSDLGLIERKELRAAPIRIEYSLTKKGFAFQGVIDAMRSYGAKYL